MGHHRSAAAGSRGSESTQPHPRRAGPARRQRPKKKPRAIVPGQFGGKSNGDRSGERRTLGPMRR